MKLKIVLVAFVVVASAATIGVVLYDSGNGSEGTDSNFGSDPVENDPGSVDPPTSSISVSDSENGVVTISHDGGSSLDGSKVHVYVDGPGNDTSNDYYHSNSGTSFESAAGISEFTPGTSATVSVNDGYTVKVTYEQGDSSKIIATGSD